jgi:hypothetical protein
VLSSTANGHLRSQHKHKQQQYDNIGQNKHETTKETGTATTKNESV